MAGALNWQACLPKEEAYFSKSGGGVGWIFTSDPARVIQAGHDFHASYFECTPCLIRPKMFSSYDFKINCVKIVTSFTNTCSLLLGSDRAGLVWQIYLMVSLVMIHYDGGLTCFSWQLRFWVFLSWEDMRDCIQQCSVLLSGHGAKCLRISWSKEESITHIASLSIRNYLHWYGWR